MRHSDSCRARTETRARCDQEPASNRLPLPRLGPWRTSINGKALHPGMNILRAIDFAARVDFCIRRKRFFDETANLLFVGGMPLNSLYNQTMRRTAGLLGERA